MGFFDIVKSIVPLVVVLGLLYGILLLVRKYSFSLNNKKNKNFHVDVVHNQIIMPKKYLSLVRIKDKILVLGISENNISVLKEFDYAEFSGDEDDVQSLKPNFVDILKQNLGMK